MEYVSLHHHSTYSYMDGYGLPETHVARAAELEMTALALSEHGNVSSHVKLEQAGEKHGVKPIFGLEAYTSAPGNRRKWHLSLLAADAVGYNNLMKITTRSWGEDFYQWPTVTGGSLKEHNEGLIVLSGCLDSHLACTLLGGKGRERGSYREAVKVLKTYKRIFGDRYYLECQRFPELPRAHELNQQYEKWSRQFGIPLVATADVHYPRPENNELQKILHAAGRNIGTVAAAEAEWEYDIKLTHPISDAEILASLRGTGMSTRAALGAIVSTGEIAERCNVTLPKMDRQRFPLNDGETTESRFRAELNRGWRYRGFHLLPRKTRLEYKARVNHEFPMMRDKDFLDYFLVLADVVAAVKDAGCPVGPARGSAAASLVCYLLRITEVNPMEYPLMFFERFIDPNRMDLPDVDLDFDDELRDMCRQYLITKYGADRVGNIGTFTRYRGKNSMDDVARVFEVPKFEVEAVKELIVERSGGDSRFDASLEDTVAMFPQFGEFFKKYPVMNQAMELEGNLKGFGVHAAGVVVGAEPLHNYVATYAKKNVGRNKNTVEVLSVDKYDGEHLGLLKGDFLGLTTMGMIRHAIEIVGMTLDDLYKIPMTDQDTLDAFERGDVVGIFQFEGRTMKMVTEEMRPRTFMDLAAINALSRPGPLHSGSTGDYLAVRHGREKIVELHPIVTEITKYTEGQIIYQEQILQICREVGQFPWVHAATIRKVISQKKGEAAFNTLWLDFEKGAASQGIDSELADRIWKRMVTAGTYAFNVAHCVSYSMLGFWAMWLKVHHPIAFYTASLRKVDPNKTDKMLAVMRDMQDDRFGRSFKVYPPVLTSGSTWTPMPDGVAAGFQQIKGIGEKVAQKIIDTRETNGEFGSWEELVTVPGIGPKTVVRIKEFAEQDDPFGIKWIKETYEEIKDWIVHEGKHDGVGVPNTLSDAIPYEDVKSYHVVMGVVKARNPQDVYENHRSRTGEELDPDTIKDPHLKDSMTLYMEDPTGLMTIKVDRWRYPDLKEQLWDIALGKDFVVVDAFKMPFYGKTIKARQLWIIDPN